MLVEVPAVEVQDLAQMPVGESSASIAQRVSQAFEQQMTRQGCVNARLSVSQLDVFAQPDDAGRKLMAKAMTQFNWSARVYHRILRVARSIADLDGSDGVRSAHIAQAIQYRRGLLSEG